MVRISPKEISKRGSVPTNGSIFFTIFQTFMSGKDNTPYFGDYPADYFDLIIIDECHRGGANDEGNWRGILEYFSPAVQLGLTATPKRANDGALGREEKRVKEEPKGERRPRPDVEEPVAPYEPKEKRKKTRIKLRDGKEREIQHMMSTSFWSADGKPISAEEFLHNLFGTLPDFFKSEEELRDLWSNPMTRKTLLDKLADSGYGKDDLAVLQKLIDAEKSDLFDVLEYVSFAIKPITREVRVADAQSNMFALLDNKQKEFLEFVLTKYIETGAEELDEEKLPSLLELKYQSISDAAEVLGDVKGIRNTFIEFQKYLYQKRVA